MSTGPRTQAAFIQGKQSALERDPSHSALLYLFQEVSKLGSPVHNSFLDTCSTSTGLNETSRLGHFIVRREEEDAQSFSISNSSCQHSLTCLSPFNQVKKVKEEGLSSSVTNLDEPRPECNSPWKVLSLINLQCERLLNPRDVGESALNSVSSVAKVGDAIDNASAAIANETDHETFLFERQKIHAGVSRRKDVTGVSSGGADRCKPQGCVKDSQMSCCAQSQTAEKTDTFTTQQGEEHATASSQPRHRDTKEDKFSVSRQLRWNQECKDRLSSERNTENVSVDALLPFNSKEETSTALSKPAPSLDQNANFILTSQLKTDTQLPQLSSVCLRHNQHHLYLSQRNIFTHSQTKMINYINQTRMC
nr:uncharacterized protein LOC114921002 [Labrus bergylta]